jgi:hypothetical protein
MLQVIKMPCRISVQLMFVLYTSNNNPTAFAHKPSPHLSQRHQEPNSPALFPAADDYLYTYTTPLFCPAG